MSCVWRKSFGKKSCGKIRCANLLQCLGNTSKRQFNVIVIAELVPYLPIHLSRFHYLNQDTEKTEKQQPNRTSVLSSIKKSFPILLSRYSSRKHYKTRSDQIINNKRNSAKSNDSNLTTKAIGNSPGTDGRYLPALETFLQSSDDHRSEDDDDPLGFACSLYGANLFQSIYPTRVLYQLEATQKKRKR